MLVLLPLISFILIFLALTIRPISLVPSTQNNTASCRQAFLRTTLVMGLLTVLATQTLSTFHNLNTTFTAAFWLGMALIAIRILICHKTRIPRLHTDFLSLSPAWLGVGSLALISAVLGTISAPNSFDSMTYHLPRVMHWAQNGSIEPFATHLSTQLWIPPLAEYALLNLFLLSGNDNLFWAIQWGAYIGCAVTASLIAQTFGINKRGQAASALIAATIPMAVLQSNSTQTDLVAAFWSMSAVYWLILWMQDKGRITLAICSATSLALGLLTKGTPLFLVTPFLALAAIFYFWKQEFKRVAILLGLTITIALLINGPFLNQTRTCFNTINRMDTETKAVNQSWDGPALLSNLLRGVAIHLTTPCQRLNDKLRDALVSAHTMIGAKLNDPRTTFGPTEFLHKKDMFYEARAGNFLHFCLLLTASAAILFRRKQFGLLPAAYVLALITGVLLLTGYLKWNLWVGRFHMGFFLLGAPVITLVLAKADPSGRLLKWSGILLFIAALPWAVLNTSRPLFGVHTPGTSARPQQYFTHDPQIAQGYISAAAAIRAQGCAKVGLILANDEWEYPLWALLRDAASPVEIRHVGVLNNSRQYEDASWDPCIIIRPEDPPKNEQLIIHGRAYTPSNYLKPLMLYAPAQKRISLSRTKELTC
ncbi:MAG: hypothetical protein HQL17_05565 [Candidatus Omnitrophica bacterium]|nr:hypothetical protein [Candidatus Omnitrophota bacterium]